MADNVAITAGTGTTVASDELTINATAAQVQRIKVVAGKDGTYTGDVAGRNVDGDSNASALYVDVRSKLVRVSVTPTISTSAYTSGDCLGGLQTVTGAVRASGGSAQVLSVNIIDKTQAQRAAMDLLFFDRSVTVAGDNAPVTMSDADMENCLGVVPIVGYNTAWPGTPLNSISSNVGVNLPVVCNGSDLFVQAVVRATPTYVATSDLVFIYVIAQD